MSASSTGSQVVTQVVKLLEDMLEKSKADGDADRKTYAKFLCYCNTQKETKTEEIGKLTEEISLLETKLEELKGSNGELSSECAKLKSDINANKQARASLEAMRKKENEAFKALSSDLTTSIEMINKAVEVLAEVGADQTLEKSATDHTKFMAGYKTASLLKLKERVAEAWSVASVFLTNKQRPIIDSFLQAPFTGTYTAQSGQVVGILKDMRDTFQRDLATATETEQKQEYAYSKLMIAKLDAFNEMRILYDEKQELLSENDEELSTKEEQSSEATKQKENCEQFLATILPMCDTKAKEYKERNMLRANEDAALTEAIAILNKESSFALFGNVAATSTGTIQGGKVALIQYSSVTQHLPAGGSARLSVEQFLRAASASAGKSLKLVKIVALLEADNPFTTVLTEISKMLALIEEEGKLDKDKFDWCKDERTKHTAMGKAYDESIAETTSAIGLLISTIEDPEKGLKAQIQATEQSLEENYESQKLQTEMRTVESQEYQKNIKNIVEAESLLGSAINVLTKYYKGLEEGNEAQQQEIVTFGGEKPPPATWEDESGYKGQSDKGKAAITMLEFILDETKKEEATAHTDENKSLEDFEDSMTHLKDEEAAMQESLAKLKKTLAEKEEELLQKKKDLEETEAAAAANLAYLEKIKPGCDFIDSKFLAREAHRAAESAALKKASTLLMGTPAYKAAVAAADLESLGSCETICTENSREDVKCKACLAKVSVPGYCAGHPDTEGC